MSNNKNTPFPNAVLSFFWLFMQTRWRTLCFVVFCPVVWAVVTTLDPFLLRVLIDRVVGFSGEASAVWSVAWRPVLLIIGLLISLDIAMRLEEYLILQTLPVIKAEMRQRMFDYAQYNSHAYFQDQMAGNLSNKILDMVRAFENL